MSIRKAGQVIAGTPRTTGGVEIGDMGFAPLGIDESLNLRRYMNGQVISQTQFVAFTTKVKSAVALFPSLATTESNWQAEKALSKFGQVGKFVIDDTAQTIRLPAVVNVQGLVDLSGIGNLVNESLPNISGSLAFRGGVIESATAYEGAFAPVTATDRTKENVAFTGSGPTYTGGFDASRSSSTYQNNAPVQQEAVQYPYYIQVATGIEETLPAIREYQVNNSDYFGKSMYSDIAPNNASWLASNGQYNARSVYPDYYDWLVERVNNGVDDFITTNFREYAESSSYVVWTNDAPPVVGMRVYGYAWSQGGGYVGRFTVSSVSGNSITFMDTVSNIEKTCTYSKTLPGSVWDSAFVVNQTDQTFRLPLLNGEEDLPGNTSIDLAIQASGSTYTASANGTIFFVSTSTSTNQFVELQNNTAGVSSKSLYSSGSNQSLKVLLDVKRGDVFMVAYQTSPEYLNFIPAVGNGTLYYYVGDTVQDASLINAGAVLGQLSNKADIDASNFNADGKSLLSGLGMPSGRYIDLTLGASGSTYTAPANGWLILNKAVTGIGQEIRLTNQSNNLSGYAISATNSAELDTMIPCRKGDTIHIYYSAADNVRNFRFVYAEGEN